LNIAVATEKRSFWDGYGDGYGVQFPSNMVDELDLTEISGEIE